MTESDIYKLFKILKSVYQGTFKLPTEEMDTLAKVWLNIFRAYDFASVEKALNEFVATDQKGFPPKPNQILRLIGKKEPASKPEIKPAGLSESSKRFFKRTGLDPKLMETDFDYVCRVAYLEGLKNKK